MTAREKQGKKSPRAKVAAKGATRDPVAQVLASMEDFARRLAILAFRSGHESGDVAHCLAERARDRDVDNDLDEGPDDALDDLWIDYWEEIYRHQFVAAYFALSKALREDLRVRRLPDRGGDWFLDTIEALEKKGGTRLPPAPKSLSFFDRTSYVEAKVPRGLDKRITADRPRASRGGKVATRGELTREGIPGLALGVGLETALAMLGAPTKRDVFGSIEFLSWPERGLHVSVCRPGFVVIAMKLFWHRDAFRSELDESAPKTFRAAPWTAKGGLAGGATAKELLAAYGKPTFDNSFEDGTVKVRVVHLAGTRFELHDDPGDGRVGRLIGAPGLRRRGLARTLCEQLGLLVPERPRQQARDVARVVDAAVVGAG